MIHASDIYLIYIKILIYIRYISKISDIFNIFENNTIFSISGSMPSSITLCYTPTHASNRCRLKSFKSCTFCGRLAAPDFVMKCIETRAVRWPEVWKFYGSLTLLHFPTGGANDAQNVSIDTARGKDNDHQNS